MVADSYLRCLNSAKHSVAKVKCKSQVNRGSAYLSKLGRQGRNTATSFRASSVDRHVLDRSCALHSPSAKALTLKPNPVLPQSTGLLPKWQLLVSVMAVFNTVQNFATLKLTRRIYNRVPVESGQAQCSAQATVI